MSVAVFEGYSRNVLCTLDLGVRHDRDRMVVGFITTYTISVYHHKRCEFKPRLGEVYSVQHYVIKFVSDLRQVGGFLRGTPDSSTNN